MHRFSASVFGPRYLGFLRNCLLIPRYFCAVYEYVEKAGLSKGVQNPPPPQKKKLEVTEIIEIIELKFGKKKLLLIHSLYFKAFYTGLSTTFQVAGKNF